MARNPTPTMPMRKQGRSKPTGQGPEGFGGLPSSLDMRDAVAVEGNRSSQDDKKHHHIREKRTHTYIDVSQLKFLECCPSPLSKRTLTHRFLLFNLFTCLPEKQIWTDRGAENRD